jgi:hypothetical protein
MPENLGERRTMRRKHHSLLALLLGVTLGSILPLVAAEAQPNCGPPHRMVIVDLNMVPDPIRSGQPVEAWQIAIRSDRNGECHTSLQVYDHDQLAGFQDRILIRPGRAVYTVAASPHYRFHGRDPCFVVHANIGGAFTPVDTARAFCAKPVSVPVWTLRE